MYRDNNVVNPSHKLWPHVSGKQKDPNTPANRHVQDRKERIKILVFCWPVAPKCNHLVMIVCLSGRMSSSTFLISGSNPMSSILSASSKTCGSKGRGSHVQGRPTYELDKQAVTQTLRHNVITDEVGDAAEFDHVGGDQVVESPRRRHHNLHTLLHGHHLLPSAPATVHAHAAKTPKSGSSHIFIACFLVGNRLFLQLRFFHFTLPSIFLLRSDSLHQKLEH